MPLPRADEYNDPTVPGVSRSKEVQAARNPTPPAPAPAPVPVPQTYNWEQKFDRLWDQGAPQVDLTNANAIYGQAIQDWQNYIAQAEQRRQESVARSQLLQLSQGMGPAADAARAQLQAGVDAANSLGNSQVASARGGAGQRALMARSAARNSSMNVQQSANQAAAMRAQMAIQGTEGLANLDASDAQARERELGNIATTRNAQAGTAANAAGTNAGNALNWSLGRMGLVPAMMGNQNERELIPYKKENLGAQTKLIGAQAGYSDTQKAALIAAMNRGDRDEVARIVGAGTQALKGILG